MCSEAAAPAGERTAPVNRIIPFSLVDGPGNRSAVFFQGCDFHCRYCHNPETIRMCSGCGRCVKACPAGALSLESGGPEGVRGLAAPARVVWNQEMCCGCDTCIGVCENNSSPKIRWMTVDGIFAELQSALPFITGITVSGGECTRQDIFVAELFRRAHELGKTAYVDTNGQRDFKMMPELMEQMDMAMLDVKAADEAEHRMVTGKSNDVVLANARYLAEAGKLYEIRTVVVPGLLDNERTVREVGRFLSKYPAVRYKLIKYRPWGVKPPLDVVSPDDSYMENLRKTAADCGVREIVIT